VEIKIHTLRREEGGDWKEEQEKEIEKEEGGKRRRSRRRNLAKSKIGWTRLKQEQEMTETGAGMDKKRKIKVIPSGSWSLALPARLLHALSNTRRNLLTLGNKRAFNGFSQNWSEINFEMRENEIHVVV